ncbi:MAG: FliA/WhiG family RNA polymerase sigma factor [Chloroflexota bacterium]|nr:MAG: FliA/WhiG family RNA polymerase sigma factor [Chloroflexota bacterium]
MNDNRELWKEYTVSRAPEMRQELILRYVPLVKFVIGRMSINLPAILDSDDILAYGTMGLIDAIDRYDPSRGVEFEAYAPQRIRGSVVDALRRCNLLSRSTVTKARQVEEAIAHLQQSLGRQPTDMEVAARLEITPQALQELMPQLTISFMSLETPLAGVEDGAVVVADILEDSSSPNPEESAVVVETRQALRLALRELPERDRQVLALYYYEELTLREISAVLGISQARVHQLHARAILRLRAAMRSSLGQSGDVLQPAQAVAASASAGSKAPVGTSAAVSKSPPVVKPPPLNKPATVSTGAPVRRLNYVC